MGRAVMGHGSLVKAWMTVFCTTTRYLQSLVALAKPSGGISQPRLREREASHHVLPPDA